MEERIKEKAKQKTLPRSTKTKEDIVSISINTRDEDNTQCSLCEVFYKDDVPGNSYFVTTVMSGTVVNVLV